MSKTTLGWIGLGNMGIPMCRNLLKAGYPLTVYNRTTGKEKELTDAGAQTAESPAKLLQSCEVVFVMVSDDAAVKAVFNGEDGLLSAAISNQSKIIINTSTISPETTKQVAQQCNNKGIAYLEAPVSGSVKPAEDATLIVLAGGPKTVFNSAKPILDCLGKMVMHLGYYGSAGVAKLAINLLVGFNMQGLAETVLFAQQHGIDAKDMLTIVNEGGCANGTTKAKTPVILSGNYAPAFSVKNYAKDLRLAKNTGITTPLANTLHDTYQAALDKYEEEDAMAILKYLQEKE
ncbi:NAD(P)-dependent oxidoreductase [Ilyomonas limi]|uniref:NAD(P)-dependent oxidoreductase n=1 Tax=Ilyomonas limi TaxID=2575867 RepID=A0A4U3L762_9BACT|nr:NAD(P)-dependent oxidoreductase [Ilyomonas limi]TKK70289.1 NAD(P)-dependent oxidoreductase [Ilyomonas limi]